MIKKEISSMLLAASPYPMLLPGVCIAEVLEYIPPHCHREVPDWYLGELTWRGQVVSMISMEILSGQSPLEVTEHSRMVIFNGHLGVDDVAFYAMVTPDTPKLIRVMEDQIEEITDDDPPPFTKMHVSIFGERAIIPDLLAIESELIPWTVESA